MRRDPLGPDRFIEKQLEVSPGARIGFWVLAGVGAIIMAVAWTWYGSSHLEAESEQGKALAVGKTMEGFAEVVGGIPLAVSHLLGLIILLILGWLGWRSKGLVFGIVAVVVASFIGIAVAQILFSGELFEVGLQRYR